MNQIRVLVSTFKRGQLVEIKELYWDEINGLGGIPDLSLILKLILFICTLVLYNFVFLPALSSEG